MSQAEASCLEAEASLLDLKQQVTEMENTLCALLAWERAVFSGVTLEEQAFPQSLSVGVPLQLLSDRPMCSRLRRC